MRRNHLKVLVQVNNSGELSRCGRWRHHWVEIPGNLRNSSGHWDEMGAPMHGRAWLDIPSQTFPSKIHSIKFEYQAKPFSPRTSWPAYRLLNIHTHQSHRHTHSFFTHSPFYTLHKSLYWSHPYPIHLSYPLTCSPPPVRSSSPYPLVPPHAPSSAYNPSYSLPDRRSHFSH